MSEITTNAIKRFIVDGHAAVIFDGKDYDLEFTQIGFTAEYLRTPALKRELEKAIIAREPVGDKYGRPRWRIVFAPTWLATRSKIRISDSDIADLRALALNRSTASRDTIRYSYRPNYRLYGAGLIDIEKLFHDHYQQWMWDIQVSPSGVAALEAAGKTIPQLIAERDAAAAKAKQEKNARTVFATWESEKVLVFTCDAFPKLVIRADYSDGKPIIRLDGAIEMGDLHFRVDKLLTCVYMMAPSDQGNPVGQPREWDAPR